MTLLPPQVAQALNLPTTYSAAKEVGEIKKALSALFKAWGFVSNGRTFNRKAGDGTIQVAHFVTMPATSSAYGRFALEVGLYVPEVWDMQHGVYGAKLPKTFGVGDCVTRMAIVPQNAVNPPDQHWEALAHPELIKALHAATEAGVPAFFDRYGDRKLLVAELSRSDASVPWIFHHAPIILAMIEAANGQKGSAHARLRAYLRGLPDDVQSQAMPPMFAA